MSFAEAQKAALPFRGNGLTLQEMTVGEVMEAFPKYHNIVNGQRQVLWDRCRACMM